VPGRPRGLEDATSLGKRAGRSPLVERIIRARSPPPLKPPCDLRIDVSLRPWFAWEVFEPSVCFAANSSAYWRESAGQWRLNGALMVHQWRIKCWRRV